VLCIVSALVQGAPVKQMEAMGFGDDIHLLKVAGPNGQLAECICVKQQGKHGGPLYAYTFAKDPAHQAPSDAIHHLVSLGSIPTFKGPSNLPRATRHGRSEVVGTHKVGELPSIYLPDG